jgi:hypothetical protein
VARGQCSVTSITSFVLADLLVCARVRTCDSVGQLRGGRAVGGRAFERLVKWVLETAPEYAAALGPVWLWADWPGNGGRIDAGIDLVAEDRDGRLWAVQTKHYDPSYAIKKADLDSFLSESSRREFSSARRRRRARSPKPRPADGLASARLARALVPPRTNSPPCRARQARPARHRTCRPNRARRESSAPRASSAT